MQFYHVAIIGVRVDYAGNARDELNDPCPESDRAAA